MMNINKNLPQNNLNITVDMQREVTLQYLRGVLSSTEAHLSDVLNENKKLTEELRKIKK